MRMIDDRPSDSQSLGEELAYAIADESLPQMLRTLMKTAQVELTLALADHERHSTRAGGAPSKRRTLYSRELGGGGRRFTSFATARSSNRSLATAKRTNCTAECTFSFLKMRWRCVSAVLT